MATAVQKTSSTHRTAVFRGAHQLDILGYTTRRRLGGADNTVRSRSFDAGGFLWTLVCRFHEKLARVKGVTLVSVSLELSRNETDEAVVATASVRIDDPSGTGRWPAAEWHSEEPNVFPARSSTALAWELAVPDAFREHEERYVDEDTNRLTVHCTVDVHREESVEGPTSRSCLVSMPPRPSLSKDIHRLREKMWWSDVTFVVEEAKIRAHKLVLAMRSPVFAAEFRGDMKEKTMRCIRVVDMTAMTFRAMLYFIYTDELPKPKNKACPLAMARDLLVAADLYDLERLRLMCENILSQSIAIDNVMETLMLSHFFPNTSKTLAMSSSSSVGMASPLPTQGTAEKLTRENFLLWETQVLPAVRGARLMGFLDGTNKAPSEKITVDNSDGKGQIEVSNPDYENWVQTDQQVLHYLLASLSKEILVSCIGMRTASTVWLAIKSMFAAKSRTRIANLRVRLANTKKEGKTTAQYFAAVKAITDELAAAGRPMEEDEVVEYLLAGLDDPYNPLFAAIGANPDHKVTVADLYAQLDSYDNHMRLLIGTDGDVGKSSANAASRGRGGGGRRGGRGANRGRGGGRGYGRGQGRHQDQGGRGRGRHGGGNKGGKDRDLICQICDKPGHPAWRCWHRYSDDEEEEEEKGANVASYGVDTNWYGDSGATDHITGELDKLTMKEKYKGRDQIHAANGQESKKSSITLYKIH
ncbi:hypothetical protein QYE76_000351 [Lolium multiflorum]|uniref:BTB domain-containing protein n=1 Tax=Lolium multiflorum TaxID=4521 RepID=A0AAD8RLP7_LOLMU|nr:hypothetical protein QYE76_000351 [Lolium multiflorum]